MKENNSKSTKNVSNNKECLIDLSGFVIIIGYLDIIMKGIGVNENIRLLISFVILTIRLMWWDKNKSVSGCTLTLRFYSKLLWEKFLTRILDKSGTFV